MEQMDYELLPEEAWDILIDHYGIFDNQHPIARKVFTFMVLYHGSKLFF